MLPDFWFERGIGDVGQSMGVTATGILLLRMVDPENRSGGFESFAYKQLFFEPIVGGGLFTAAAPVLVVQLGGRGDVAADGGLIAVLAGLWTAGDGTASSAIALRGIEASQKLASVLAGLFVSTKAVHCADFVLNLKTFCLFLDGDFQVF